MCIEMMTQLKPKESLERWYVLALTKMAFYIKPPEGFGALEKLRVYALRRMNFLLEVLKCAEATDFQELLEKGTTAVHSDCLIEGSRKDRISHFLLR